MASASRKGTRTTLWGQIRPGSGKRSYRLEVFNGRWRPLGGTAKTSASGYFTRTVTLQKNARVRVYSVRDRAYSPPLVVS